MSIGYCSDCDTEYGHRADCPRTKPSYTHLQQQLTDCKKQNVMLRNAITEGLSTYKVPMTARIVEALAATADLENVRLCEKEPVTTWYGENGEYKFPLYRAREPTK